MTVCGSPPRPSSPDNGKATASDDQSPQSDITSTGQNPMSNPSAGQKTRVLFDPGPRPRVMPKEAICFTMKLGSNDVAGPNPMLHLCKEDVYHLTESDELQMDPPVLFSRDLRVIDSSNRHYMMNVSNRETGSPFDFHLNSEWHEFVFTNRLRERDTLMFYRFLDDATGRLYYRLDFFKVPKAPPPPVCDPADDESCCLSRTLTASQVDPIDPLFLIDARDAYDLTCSDLFQGLNSTTSSMSLLMYHKDTAYSFELSPFFANKGFVGYRICGDWAQFVEDNKLEAGDRVFFLVDLENKAEEMVYLLKFLRKNPLPSDDVYTVDEVTSVERKYPDPIMMPGLGYSMPPGNEICLSRALASYEVVHAAGKPRLFLDSFAVKFFMGPYCFGSLKENLVVFDDRNRQYDMLLSYLGTEGGEMVYAVDAGWQRFVKIHNLKAGDHIKICRMLANNIFRDKTYHFMITYERKKIRSVSVPGTSGDGCEADPPRSNGWWSSGKGKGIA